MNTKAVKYLSMATITLTCQLGFAYDMYSGGADGGCVDCHGDFRGPTSPKGTVFPSGQNHEMHRASGSMGTSCNLCHSGASRTPVYTYVSSGTANNTGLGCSGCHLGPGLRKHHFVNGVTLCYDCHTDDPPPPAETEKPPYYDTPDTKVKNPGNTVLLSNTNENWSVGDFLGLDNDGNNLYDLADYAVGPNRLLALTIETNAVRVTWLTAGGRTEAIQAGASPGGTYTNVSPDISIPGVGLVTNNYTDAAATSSPLRFYRVDAQVP